MAFELNEFQKKAVEYYGEKPLLIEAGPGSGKTRVITERVKFLIEEKNMDPESFLIITFSNKAANELKERLRDYFDDETIRLMQISTVHSFCYKLLIENTNISYKILDDDYGTKKNMFIYKHRERLGFKKESTLTRGKVSDVVAAFDKYSTFNVDTEKLIDYIKENEPVSQDYIDFVHEEFRRTGKFPRRKIDLDKKKKNLKRADDYHAYADNWYNALHLQVAKAYPKYLELLDEYNYLDFNVLQMRALEYLKENPETQYKNILVDEFQDTDPVQIEIFEILMRNALHPKDFTKEDLVIEDDSIESNGNNEDNKFDLNNDLENKITASFTAVGDIDQSIYGFRGALENYFEYFYNKYDTERVGLNINYRSTDEIIEFTERYIKKQRDKDSKKSLTGNRKESRNIYYIENDESEMEAASLAKIIKLLKENDLIENYSDVAVLLRSVLTSSKDIINVFEDEKIPFQIKGLQDLDKKDEIRSILTLLHFVIEDENPEGVPIISHWETEWLNLRAFTNEDFNQKIVQLSDETQKILIEKQKEFEDSVFEFGKSVYYEKMGKKCPKRSYKGTLELEDEILEDVFKLVKKPVLTNQTLIDYGISDADDLAFFNRLNRLRSRIFSVDFDERPTILDVYYEILEICGFLDEEYIFDEANKEAMEYIGLFTQIIYEYENIISNKDIRGLYWFLNSNIGNYSYDIENENGVNIMTIHKSKGLEFPVVILAALNDATFPREYENLREVKYKNGAAVFYTPRECLRYKTLEKDDVLLHYEEEERNLYVAMTRAQDLLILSRNFKKPRKTTYSKSLQKDIDDLEFKEKISRIREEIEELKEKANVEDISFVNDDLKEELKSIKAELKELKPLIKEQKKLVKETKKLEDLLIELQWKIEDIKYENLILDELIELFGYDSGDLGSNKDEIKDLILNIYALDGDEKDNKTIEDLSEDEKDNKSIEDLSEDEKDNKSIEDFSEDENNEKPIKNLSEEENNIESIEDLSEDENDKKSIEDLFEDKEPLSDILAHFENEIFDLNEDISKEDDTVSKLIEKLVQLQDNDLQNQKSQIHLKYKLEIQNIINQSIDENEDTALSKNEIALNSLIEKLKLTETEIKENKESIEGGKELIAKEKELNNKKSYLEYKIEFIKDQDNFDKKYELEYSLTRQEEFKIIKELEELSKSLMDDSIDSLYDLNQLKSKITKAQSPKLCEDFVNNRDLIYLIQDDDSFVKLEALFKIKDNEKIDDVSDIGILKDKADYSEQTQKLFMSIYYKNLEIENKKRLEFIINQKSHLVNLINSFDGVRIIDSGNLHQILNQEKIPNVLEIDESKKIFLSYSSIESYESCPLKYHLSYNYKFRISDNSAITHGNINHNSLEEINKLIIERKEKFAKENGIEIIDIDDYLASIGKTMDNELFISKKEMLEIIRKIYYDDPNINRNELTIEEVEDNLLDYWENHGRRLDILGSEYRFDINKAEEFTLVGSIDLLYKTENGIVILDYKTTKNISEEAKKKYKKQLYTYAIALKDDSLYGESIVDNMQIYAIKSQDMLDFEFDEDKLAKRQRDIETIADNIINNRYPSKTYNENSNDCYYCKYSFICRNTLL